MAGRQIKPAAPDAKHSACTIRAENRQNPWSVFGFEDRFARHNFPAGTIFGAIAQGVKREGFS